MIYHAILVGRDGFTKEDEMISKDDKIPARLFVDKHGKISFYRPFETTLDEEELRSFYLVTSFYGLGKHIIVFKEIR